MLARVKKIIVCLFLSVHVLMIVSWSIPTEIKLKGAINQVFQPYLYATGLWQGWDMFAPNPRSTQLWMDATVSYSDGSEEVWDFPRMERLGVFERFQKERYRKWAHDHVRLDTSSALWQPTAEYIARIMAREGKEIVKIEFTRHWYDLKLQDENREVASDEWKHYKFFTYNGGGKKP